MVWDIYNKCANTTDCLMILKKLVFKRGSFNLNCAMASRVLDKNQNADFCENFDWEDHHIGGGAQRFHRKCEG